MYLHLLNRLQHGAGIDIWKGVDLFVDLRTGLSIQFNGHYRFAAFLLSGKTEIADINAFFSHDLCYSSNDAGGIFVKDDESGILAGKRNFHAWRPFASVKVTRAVFGWAPSMSPVEIWTLSPAAFASSGA